MGAVADSEVEAAEDSAVLAAEVLAAGEQVEAGSCNGQWTMNNDQWILNNGNVKF